MKNYTSGKAYSTMPSGVKKTVILEASDNYINGYTDVAWGMYITTYTHPFMRMTDVGDTFISGVERVVNLTTDTDVTSYINYIDDDVIYFDGSVVSDGDKIEITVYCDDRAMYGDREANMELVEAWYRSAAHMDRCDFANYPPPFNIALKQLGGYYDVLEWTFKHKLFYSQYGFPHTHSPQHGGVNLHGPMKSNWQTLISYSPGSSSVVGTFVGDKVWNYTSSGANNAEILCPVPFYLTQMDFFAKHYNSNSEAEYKVIELEITIDGNTRCITTSPGLMDGNMNALVGRFGTDLSYYIPLKKQSTYSVDGSILYNWKTLPNDPEYGHDFDDTYSYPIHSVYLGLVRANSLTVRARLHSDDEEAEINDWFIGFSGWITKGQVVA